MMNKPPNYSAQLEPVSHMQVRHPSRTMTRDFHPRTEIADQRPTPRYGTTLATSQPVKTVIRKEAAAMTVKIAAVTLLSLSLGACAQGGMSSFDLFSRKPAPASIPTAAVSLPEDMDAIAGDGALDGRLRNASALAAGKRYGEAQRELASLSATLPADSTMWVGVKCAEMTAALRANDMNGFHAAAAAVERKLADPLRPPAGCAAPLALARKANGQPLPLGVPDGLAKVLK